MDTRTNVVKLTQNASGAEKDKHEGGCDGPKKCSNCSGSHASSDKACPVWIKEKEIQCVRVEQRIPFPEARRVVEAKSPTVVSAGRSYSAVLSNSSKRSQSVSVSCQTDLTWVSSVVPKSVGPLSISIAVQAASVIPASSVISFEGLTETFRKPITGSAPVKTAAKGSADPSKSAPKGQADPPQTAPKSSADPFKTAPSIKVRSKSGSPRGRSSLQL